MIDLKFTFVELVRLSYGSSGIYLSVKNSVKSYLLILRVGETMDSFFELEYWSVIGWLLGLVVVMDGVAGVLDIVVDTDVDDCWHCWHWHWWHWHWWHWCWRWWRHHLRIELSEQIDDNSWQFHDCHHLRQMSAHQTLTEGNMLRHDVNVLYFVFSDSSVSLSVYNIKISVKYR